MGYIRSAIRLNPHPSALYLFVLGLSYFVLGQYEEAIVAFKRGVELRDVFLPNHVQLAITYAMLGHKREAAEERDKVLALAGGRKPPTADMWLDATFRDRETGYLKLAGLL